MLMNNFEYYMITPFEFIFRKIGTILACISFGLGLVFLYYIITDLIDNGYNSDCLLNLLGVVVCICMCFITNTIKLWLSGRRLELSRMLDTDFHYKFIEKNYQVALPSREVVNYSSPFEVYKNKEEQKENVESNIKKGFDNSDELLNNLIGLNSVKEEVLKLKLKLELEKKQELQGRKNKSTYNMHMFFTGNPGTGKTTVARIITGILYDMGYIKENKCVEVGKQDIVGQYLGQSAQKTNEVIKKAIGGVLFIDEAYSLCENYHGDGFAKESVEVILKSMEDYRDKLIVIFAGYTKEMKKFKEMNPGLKSRIGLTIEFPDYNADELTQIFIKKANDNDYEIGEQAIKKVHMLCDLASREKDFGNGRFVENLFREIETNHAFNTKDLDAYDDKILTILPEDIDLDILEKIL